MNDVDDEDLSFEIVERFLQATDRILDFTSVHRAGDNGIHTCDLANLLKITYPEQWGAINE